MIGISQRESLMVSLIYSYLNYYLGSNLGFNLQFFCKNFARVYPNFRPSIASSERKPTHILSTYFSEKHVMPDLFVWSAFDLSTLFFASFPPLFLVMQFLEKSRFFPGYCTHAPAEWEKTHSFPLWM